MVWSVYFFIFWKLASVGANGPQSGLLNVSLVSAAQLSCNPSTVGCSPRLQLTPALANQKGAAWAGSAVSVLDPFNITFTFRISSWSLTCPYASGSSSSNGCVGRGGHGFAFVIRGGSDDGGNINNQTIGDGGNNLGYGNLLNSIAVEFDTWYDEALQDQYDNHIGIQVRGYRNPNSAHHQYAIGMTSNIPDILDGHSHTVKLSYRTHMSSDIIDPSACVNTLSCGALQSMANVGTLYSDGYLPNGVGTITLWMDDFTFPLLIAPVDLSTVLNNTNEGLAFIGFTGRLLLVIFNGRFMRYTIGVSVNGMTIKL